MKHAVYAPIFNDYGDPARLVELAVASEAAGFDGFFIWDHLVFEAGGALEVVDATVVLGAVAQATRRLRLGAMITPLARRRPWKFAREAVTLDHLSDGRLTVGVGLGEPAELEFDAFGENGDARVRAARLDEGLAIFDRLARGERVDHAGDFYQVRDTRFAPRARQQPAIPVWVAATLPARAGLRRAARWDGVVPVRMPEGFDAAVDSAVDWSDWWLRPDEFAAMVAWTTAQRTRRGRFDFVASGRLGEAGCGGADLAAYREAGATWWFSWVDEAPGTFEATLERVRQGPPR